VIEGTLETGHRKEPCDATQSTAPPDTDETGPCRSCRAKGYVPEDVAYDHETGELTEAASICLMCRGIGRVFTYPNHAEERL
jgi:hypothetical protein